MGAISHSRGVLHGSYQSLSWGTSREISVTPVGYFTGAISHSCVVLHGSYRKSLSSGVSRGLFCTGENEVFQSNRNDFPKVSFTLDGI
jgi:hypothetical protein